MIEDIQKIVCRYYKVDLLSLKSRSRRKEICYPRSIAIYLCREYTDNSLISIGDAFHRQHPVILYNYENIKRRLEIDYDLRREVEFLKLRIPVEINGYHTEIIEELENEVAEILGDQ